MKSLKIKSGFFFTALGLIVSSQLVGCASVSNGTTSAIKIDTLSKDGRSISGARCELSNDSGTVSLTTPGSVIVHRSSSDLKITCTKDGFDPASGTATSRMTGSFYGNILIGGGIGMIVDHSNGSAYNYPEWMQLVMGSNLFFDRRNSADNLPTPSTSIANGTVDAQPASGMNTIQQNQAASAAAPTSIRVGQSSKEIEKLAEQQSCKSEQGAGLVSQNGPTTEDYKINCIDGRQLAAHCEYRQCTLSPATSTQ